jgi:hypothetical protein
VHVLDLALGMRREFDVVVATGEEGYLADSCRQRGIPVHVVSHLGREIDPVADLRGLREIVHLLRGVKPDLVHSHTFKAGFLGRLAAGYLKIACVHTVHMWHFGPAAPLIWRAVTPVCERVAARRCDRIIAVSEQAARTAV